ncbi:MAG: DUF554 domain-containing protein [Oscillospiraceae bacterium]|jgi:uncharacterized membrane protein YqgA involved in biofilm formation|nr:DUF554 domain-containing protein [Oscillospiraceae bacterium]
MLGVLANVAAVLAGGLAGLLLRGRLSEALTANLTKAIGLCVCIIGVSGALKGDAMLLVLSLSLGAFTGELINIDKRLNNFGLWLQKKFSRGRRSNIAEGFTSATLLFCVGAMAVVGSIDSGLRGDNSILFAKSLIDGISAMVMSSALGAGVLFSAAAVFVYQGLIVLFSGFLQSVLVDALIVQISAAGSVMILGIGLNMALSAKIKAANLLPGLLFAAMYHYLFLN